MARSLAIATVLCLAGCGGSDGVPPSARGRGALVVVIDALRYDHLSAHGYDRRTTPYLARFAQEAVTFTKAWAASPVIVESHVALMTGCDPTIAQRPSIVLSDGSTAAPLSNSWIPDGVPRLATEFLANGWSTAAFADHAWIGGLRGFDRGFIEWFDFGGERPEQVVEIERFAGWLADRDEDEDWFAYLHINDLERIWQRTGHRASPDFEPRPELDWVPPVGLGEPVFHALPPSRWSGLPLTVAEYEIEYDTALIRIDTVLERLFKFLEERGSWDRTTVVVCGSYGFGFGESGFIVDSGTLSDVDLHVPLLVRPASDVGGIELGTRSDAVVSLVDVAPSMLDLAGIPVPEGMHGRSVGPILRGSADRIRDYAFASNGVYDGFAVFDGRWAYEYARPGSRGVGPLTATWFGDDRAHRTEIVETLKDVDADPRPGNLLRGIADPAVAARLRTAGEDWYALVVRARDILHLPAWDADKGDPEEIAELRELGLIGDLE